MNLFIDRIRQWWSRTDRSQRTVTLGGIGLVVVLVIGVAFIATRPRYETLFANLTDQEQSAVVTDLQNMGFDVKFDRAGVVEVPAGDKATARVRLAAGNKLPRAQGQWGIGELNTTHLGETPQVEQERLKAIAEGEIAKSIEAMDGVDSARVQLTIPERSAFANDQKPSSASVSIIESADANLTIAQGRAIALLVKNAVDGLDTKDIVVVNQHLQTIWNGEDEQADGIGGAERKTDIDASVSKDRERELQTLLDGAFGPGAAIVTVHADVDMDSAHTITVQQTPTGVSSAQSSTEKVVGGGKPIGGLAGANGQTGTPTAKEDAGTGNYTGETQNKQYLSNSLQSEGNKAIGAIKGMAINVVVDSSRGLNPKDVTSMLLGDLGDKIKLDATGNPLPNQPYSVKVTSVAFDTTAAAAAKSAASAAASQQRMQQILSVLPIGALLLVAALVIRQVAKFAKSQAFSSLPTGSPTHSVSLPSTPALPEADLQGLLQQLEANSDTHYPERVRYEEPLIEVEDIKNRIHIPLEQLKKMADERPALVAQLIKSMMLEERK